MKFRKSSTFSTTWILSDVVQNGDRFAFGIVIVIGVAMEVEVDGARQSIRQIDREKVIKLEQGVFVCKTTSYGFANNSDVSKCRRLRIYH